MESRVSRLAVTVKSGVSTPPQPLEKPVPAGKNPELAMR
jgi:hypothetical protein